MIPLMKRLQHAPRLCAIVSVFLAVAHTADVRAQTVTNGDFVVPNVASAPSGFRQDGDPQLNAQGVGWTFPVSAGGFSGITVQQDAGGFNAPKAPSGSQMGWVEDQGIIRQSISFAPGNYTLSFELAQLPFGLTGGAPSASPLKIKVKIGDQTFGPFAPISTSSFNKVEVPFQIVASGVQDLSFIGDGAPYNANVEDHTTFVDAVSIKGEPGPVITSGPAEIGPATPIILEGVHFGVSPGKIKVAFPNPSETPFSDGSTRELHLDTVGVDTQASSPGLIFGSPQGSPREQTVDITIASADGKQTSNVWHARFHNDAVITSVSTNAISPGQHFFVKGWDFDSKEECQSLNPNTVMVSVLFPTRSPWNQNFAIVIPAVILGCTPDTIKIALPKDTAGVVAQTVQITYQSPGGRKSNAASVQFHPRLVTQVLPLQNVTVVSCSNQSANDQCNPSANAPDADLGCFMSVDAEGQATGPSVPDATGPSFIGWHHGCWGLSSDNGTDEYIPMSIGNDWFFTGVTGVAQDAWVENGSVSYTTIPAVLNPKGADIVLWVYISWHIGATGGQVQYDGNIMITGPVGVPFN